MGSKEIFALRRQGETAAALEMARAEYPQNASDVWFLRAYAWVLYDRAKDLVERHEVRQLSATAMSNQLSSLMREFSRMGEPLRGDAAFSQMLRLAGKASKSWQEFPGFSRWAGIDDFSAEDIQPFVNAQGKTVDSLRTQFVRAICRWATEGAAKPSAESELVEWGIGILARALQEAPGDKWLNYYQSKLHLTKGEPEAAIDRLLPVLRQQPRAVWPWALLSEILDTTRPQDALTCCIHAVQLAREEQDVAKVRIQLAERLARAGRFDEAAQQARLALAYREQHGFKRPPLLQQLLGSDWYRQVVADGRPAPLPRAETAAQALLRELERPRLAWSIAVIDHVNTDKALSFAVTGADAGFSLPHRKFPGIAELPPGTFVEVGHAGKGIPHDWRLSGCRSLPNVCETFSGLLEQRPDKDFAFIRCGKNDVFVPPALASALAPGPAHEVTCLAIRRANKQGRIGWRAVRFVERKGP